MDVRRLIEKPTLLLDQKRAKANIGRLAKKAAASGAIFRPHFKTHQSAEIGEWFRHEGTTVITVSSVDMALYFAEHGWPDITIAFPVNVRQLGVIDRLARGTRLGLLVESLDAVEALDVGLTSDVGIWIEIGAGYERSGVAWDEPNRIERIANAVQDARHMALKGILTHAGNTYGASSPAKVEEIFHVTLARMREVQGRLRRKGWPSAISVGDTPGCSIVNRFEGIDEVRPGNFVFYDLTQLGLGVCREEDIAVAVACPVVAKYPQRGRLVIHGGAVHLSKESLRDPNGRPIFGRIARMEEQGWTSMVERAYLASLSQEHGVIHAPPELFDHIRIGDLLAVLPVHSCLTANLMGEYLTLDGSLISMASYRRA